MSSARSITDYVTHPHLPVPAPRYRRTGLKTGIVHVGVGGFHRAHEAMFIDRLLAEGAADDWAICGVGVLPVDRRMRDVLRAQDGLYTLLLRHPDGIEEARIIGSLVEHIVVPDDPDAVIERIAHPDTRILSLTITEGGYCLDPVTGGFDASAAGVAADLADPEHPATVFGLVTEALRRRRERGVGGLTMMSCDNLPGNGTVARRSFVSFARLRDPALADWIESAVSFPNSMVDRITPATTPADVEHVRERYGIDDAWPVVAEPFVQWVIEDHFVAGRPPFERAGAHAGRGRHPV
ncbi:MAG: mannitol dehydrogenase family protein [Galbitalea sp.]